LTASKRIGTTKAWPLPKLDYGDLRWAQAKTETTRILVTRAKSNEPKITYTELARKLSLVIDGCEVTRDDHRLWSILCDICKEEVAAGRGMLSVIVVRDDETMMPGPHFFALAKELRYKFKSREAFWVEEFVRVCEYWKDH
jgi:hypothetical protein